MPKPLTNTEVREYIALRGYELRNDYVNSKTKLEIWCFVCEAIFTSIWNNFKSKNSGCFRCANRMNGEKKRISHKRILEEFGKKGWKVIDINQYETQYSKLDVICNKGHKTTKMYTDFKQGKGCLICKNDTLSEKFRLSLDEALKIAENASLTLLTENYKNVKELVELRCNNCETQFSTTLDSVKFKQTGCPTCNSSHGEKLLIKYAESAKLKFETEYKFKENNSINGKGCVHKRELRYDLAILEGDTLILLVEIDGIQHFKPVEFFGGEESFSLSRKRDIIKSNYALHNRIPLLRIAYDDLKNLEKCMDSTLKSMRDDCCGYLFYSNLELYSSLIKDINNSQKKKF